MTERRGTKALELWCRRITDGYPGVNVQNMTTSWRDGLAFCAMIHHFRPDLIDFNSLNKDDVYGNNELAFRTAAEHLGIPALLDAEDMASCSVPDRLSILTYLSQFYQSFGGSSPSRLALSRTKESSSEGITPVVAEPTTPKVGPLMGMRREPCAVCGMPVFLAEKLVISRTPYHRTCFRCARCANQLTPGNYYETEDGQYCCETCPDEENDKSPILHQAYNASVILGHEKLFPIKSSHTEGYQRSMSDEEKTEARAKLADEISERVPNVDVSSLTTRETRGSLMTEKSAQSAHMRLSFITSHLLNEESVENSENSSINEEEYSSDGAAERRNKDSPSSLSSLSPGGSLRNRRGPEGSSINHSIDDGHVDAAEMSLEFKNDRVSSTRESSLDIGRRSDDSNFAHTKMQKIVNLDDSLDDNEEERKRRMKEKRKNSFDTATEEATHVNNHKSYLDYKRISIRQDTKDKIGPDIDVVTSKRDNLTDDSSLSLVQRRLKMFENTNINDVTREESKVDSSSRVNLAQRNSLVGREKDVEKNLLVQRDNDEERNLLIEREMDEARNLLVEREKFEGRIDIDEEKMRIEEDSRILKNSSEGEFSMEDEKKINEERIETPVKSSETSIKLDEGFAPIVPKRSKHEVRKAERLERKKSEVTVLNASGIDLSSETIYPKDLNPFGSDEEENCEMLDRSKSSRVSTNPFGSSEDEEDEIPKIVVPPRPAMRNISNVAGKKGEEENLEDVNEEPTKRRLKAPQINFNPFWSDDDEDHESEDEREGYSLNSNAPVPKPRTIKQTPDSYLSPWKNEVNRGEIYASNSSLTSTGSTSTPGGTYRKKKPAPPPPIAKELFGSGGDSLQSSNPKHAFTGSNNSLRTTPRGRKAKPAPPPPMPTSTPCSSDLMANLTLAESPITDIGKIIESRDYEMWNDPKNGKDEANRNKQSMTTPLCNEGSPYEAYTDKSVQGKWKRKKGPAPARPTPHRRKIKVISPKDVKLELDEIEMQQQGLEKQGVRLEQLIRDKAETGNATEDTSLGMDVEELVLELFVLVNEKNELFRRQAELMLLRRQQRLEEEHADIEYQIRCLLCQPEATKTDFDKQREETLIQRLVEIVERRNEIVECLEMDRRREVEEDRSINTQMGIYAAKNKADFAKELEDEENSRLRKSKKTKLKEKAKEKILRKGHKKDADKDVDETEVKLKRQNKRKWF